MINDKLPVEIDELRDALLVEKFYNKQLSSDVDWFYFKWEQSEKESNYYDNMWNQSKKVIAEQKEVIKDLERQIKEISKNTP